MAEGELTDVIASDLLLLGSESDFDIACQPCGYEEKNVEAEGYCRDCCEYLCVDCYKYHRRMGMFRHHKLVDKDNMPKQQGNVKVKDICTERCPSHEDEIIKYFCPIHKELGCSVCVTINHTTCNVDYISEVCKDLEKSEDYKTFETRLNNLMLESENIIGSATENTKTVTDNYAKVLQDIETYEEGIIQRFNALKSDIVDKIDNIKRSNAEQINAVSNAGAQTLEELQAMSSEFDMMIDQKRYCQMFTDLKKADTTLSELKAKLDGVEEIRLTMFKFHAGEELHSVMEKQDAFGTVVKKQIHDMELVQEKDINVRSQDDKETCVISGAAVLGNEKLIITDRENCKIKLCVNKKIVSELKPEVYPWDVTKVSEDLAAVTLPDAQKVLILRCDNKLTVDREIKVNGKCRGIDSALERLFVTYEKPDTRLELLSLSGEVIMSFVTNDAGRELFGRPMYVCVNTNNQSIYVSDWDRHSVIQIDIDGNFRKEYDIDELGCPSKITVGAFGLIHVCGEDSNHIHLLTPECRKVMILESDDLECPGSISFCDATERLYIGMFYEDTVKVYKLK